MIDQIWTQNDQELIKPIDQNSWNKFPQLQQEVDFADLPQYLGYEFYQELKRNISDYQLLLDGGTYTISGVTYQFNGLKAVCAYLLYARYVKQSYINDTFSGFVKHTGDGFEKISAGEINSQYENYRSIAGQLWDDCVKYLRTINCPYFPVREKKSIKIDSL